MIFFSLKKFLIFGLFTAQRERKNYFLLSA